MARDKAGYLETVSRSHRKALGQFFTHPEVAKFMVRWTSESGKPAIHDPAFGLGAFFDASLDIHDVVFTGSEVDHKVLDYWQSLTSAGRADVYREDYLLSWGRKHGNIVCNPPYMRFQKFLNRSLVFEQFEQQLNLRLPGYTNTASAFLLKSLTELEASGRLAYIMPLEFLNTGYGELVKERLVAEAHLAAIIRLDCEKEAVPDATTSVGIILYDSSKTFSHVKFYAAKSVESLDSLLDSEPISKASYDQLLPKTKWLPYFDDNPVVVNGANATPLKNYGRFIRGIATGANQFFVLKPSRAEQLGLADSDVTPVITKSAQIKTPFFTETDYDNLVRHDAPTLLFTVNGKASEPAGSYILSGEQQGYHQRFLTKSRTPWYKTEVRRPAPLLLGVFSRGGYKIVRNQSRASELDLLSRVSTGPSRSSIY